MGRDKFPWRTVLAGLGLQTLIALIMVRPSALRDWIYANAKISADNLIYFAQQGTQLVFGPLAKREVLLDAGFDASNAMVLGIRLPSW